MEAEQVILTRQLPKTGQITTYAIQDDGNLQTGWWKGRLNVNNKVRFISKTINGDVIVIDRATGLTWAADGNAAGCNNGGLLNWNESIAYVGGLNFAGFSDWRLPNIMELASTINFSKANPAIDETFFPNTIADKYQSSTTRPFYPNEAFHINYSVGFLYYTAKTTSLYLRCVRGGV